MILFLLGCFAAADLPIPATPLTAAKDACPAPYDQRAPQAGWNQGFEVAGQSRSLYVMLPEALSGPAPVLVAFNGTGEDGASFARRAGLADFVARGFIVLAPSSNGNGVYWPVWDGLRPKGHENDPNADVALFDALLACTAAHYPVDQARIYVGGHSAGGIFTNHLLQRRSSVIAGAIVASGVYSQTSPDPALPIDPALVIVTWGGENDRWSGRAGGVAVKDMGFVAEASVATHAYAAAPGVSVVACEGDRLGHAWLDPLNGWMIDLLLAHPKGSAPLASLPPTPAGAPATCTLGPWDDSAITRLMCPESTVEGCQQTCQQVADGAVVNRTVAPVLRRELKNIGFKEDDCAGCIARCEGLAKTEADAEVLACMTQQPPVDLRIGGIAGATPLIDAVNTCCDGREDSRWCVSVCGELRHNLVARAYFDRCPR